MLTNKEINEILRQKKRELTKFAKFLGISRQALVFRLGTEDKKNNLDGMFVEFLINEKRKK